MEMVSCYCCPTGNTRPKNASDAHHKIPQAAGGTDKDLVWLCPNCHDFLHRLAKMLASQDRVKEVSAMLAFLTDEGQKKRIAELANLVAQYMNYKQEGLVDLDELEFPVSFVLNKDEHAKLRAAGIDSRLGMQGFAKQAVLSILNKMY